MSNRKHFVLDTNVILHDSSCLSQFDNNDVYIPMAVLEELDRFKKGSDMVNYHAREFVRRLDDLSDQPIFKQGARLGPGRGKLFILLSTEIHGTLRLSFPPSADNHILNCAFALKARKRAPVVLITKDVNLRMKAKAIGVHADDYNTDKITVDALEDSGIRHIEHLSSEDIQRLYEADAGLHHSELGLDPEPNSNEYFIFKAPSRSVLATFDESTHHMMKIQRRDVHRIRPRNAEQVFSVDALLNPNIPLVALSGKAGTGKTLLTMAAALAMESSYSQIFLSRPIIPMGNRDIGYLPGSANAKMDPYIKPLYDNLSVIEQQQDQKGKDRIKRLMDSDRLKISPLAYIRGRSLTNTFFIVDEAQNLTPHEVKTIITRAGQGTKIVLTGDIHQIDHPYLDTESNGLSYVIEKMKGQPLFAHVRLQKGERSALADLGSDLL